MTIKISQLPAGAPLAANQFVPIVQAGNTVRVDIFSNIRSTIKTDPDWNDNDWNFAFTAVTDGRFLLAANNLSDIPDPAAARENLGIVPTPSSPVIPEELGTMALQDADDVSIIGGSIDGVEIGLADPRDAVFQDVGVDTSREKVVLVDIPQAGPGQFAKVLGEFDSGASPPQEPANIFFCDILGDDVDIVLKYVEGKTYTVLTRLNEPSTIINWGGQGAPVAWTNNTQPAPTVSPVIGKSVDMYVFVCIPVGASDATIYGVQIATDVYREIL